MTYRNISLISSVLFIALVPACRQGTTYSSDRRAVSSVPQTEEVASSPVRDLGTSDQQFDVIDNDPNDPCGEAKAFGSKDQNKAFIVGGEAATDDDLVTKSTVKVILGGGHCTGTLIGPNQVITAGHCFWGNNQQASINRASQVRLGFGTTGTMNSNVTVTSVTIHPKFRGVLGNSQGYAEAKFHDIAVVTFRGNPGDEYQPVVVGSSQAELDSGTPVVVAGFGAYGEEDGMIRPLTLVETNVDEVLSEFNEIQLTVGTGRGPCYGDSGGPTYIFDKARSCLKLVGSTTGPGRKSNYTCEDGSGTLMDVTNYRGWMKCTFEDVGAPLAYLPTDSSSADCAQNDIIR